MGNLSEQEIRQIAEVAVRQLGAIATPASIDTIVRETIKRIEQDMHSPALLGQSTSIPVEKKSTERIIVTAFGKNKMGILAGLTGAIADLQCDVVDLSQKILQEFFTIMLLVDISQSPQDFESIKNRLVEAGEKFDLKVIVQHERIFQTMHRI